MVRGEPRQEAGGGLADALAQAVHGRLELAILHFARDRPCLGHGGFAPPAALGHRRPEQGALQFGHLETRLAGLGGQRALVVAGAERLPTGLALVSGGVGDLVGLDVEHGVDGLLDLDSNQGIELGLEHGVVELYDFIGHGCLCSMVLRPVERLVFSPKER